MSCLTPTRCQLPTELLHQVILDYFSVVRWQCDRGEQPRLSSKPPWEHFQPLILASKTLRQLTLEHWFEVYYARSPDDLLNIWPEVGTWTKELHCVELGTDLHPLPIQWNLRAFHRLRRLRVDFDPSQSNATLLMRFDYPRNIACCLQELEVHDISWPSPMTIHIIAEAFPGLRVLTLSQDLVWCHLCNICRFATFKDHPPEEIVYEKVVGLPSHYALYLKPLAKLERMTLTVAYALGGGVSLSENNAVLWTGECDACMDIMLEELQLVWPEKKATLERPPALTSVKWRFRYKEITEVVADFDDDPELLPTPVDESLRSGSECG